MNYRDSDEQRFLTPDDPVGLVFERLLLLSRVAPGIADDYAATHAARQLAAQAFFRWRYGCREPGAITGWERPEVLAQYAAERDPLWAPLAAAMAGPRHRIGEETATMERRPIALPLGRGRNPLYAVESARLFLTLTCAACGTEERFEIQQWEQTTAGLGGEAVEMTRRSFEETPCGSATRRGVARRGSSSGDPARSR